MNGSTAVTRHRRAVRTAVATQDDTSYQLHWRALPLVAIAALLALALGGCNAQQNRVSQMAPQAQPVAQETVVATAQPMTQPKVGAVAALAATGKPATGGRIVAGRKPGFGAGLASWYGDRFHGRRTANGERYDMNMMTAAHPSMPLPSYARITNVSNGRSVVVRVNDRGPFHKGRVIDVSKRAADVLGFRSAGVGNVKIDFVGRASTDGSDDRKLLATYQEFGRPAAPAGVQMAGLRPVTDAELAAGGTLAPTMVAMNAPVVQPVAQPVVVAAQPALRPAVQAAPQPVAVAAAAPVRVPSAAADVPASAIGYAADQNRSRVAPMVARVEKPVAKPAAPKVVAIQEPVLASAAPAVQPVEVAAPVEAPAQPKPNRVVASRIASSFEGFGNAAPVDAQPGLSPTAAFSGLR